MTLQPRLDRRITIETPATARALDGSVVPGWTAVCTVYAQKKDVPSLRRGEVFSAEQHVDTVFTEFTIRYRSGLTGVERVTYGGLAYNLRGIPVEAGTRRQYLVLIAERGAVK